MKTKKFFRKNSLIFYITATFFIGLIFFGTNAHAAFFDYKLLETIPFIGNTGDNDITISKLALGLYRLLMAATVIASLFMISVGGFYYMASAGNAATASSAKKIITDALLGLLIAVISYLMLYVINPDLVIVGETSSFFQAEIKPDLSSSVTTTPTDPVCEGILDQANKSGMLPENVDWSYIGRCTSP